MQFINVFFMFYFVVSKIFIRKLLFGSEIIKWVHIKTCDISFKIGHTDSFIAHKRFFAKYHFKVQ